MSPKVVHFRGAGWRGSSRVESHNALCGVDAPIESVVCVLAHVTCGRCLRGMAARSKELSPEKLQDRLARTIVRLVQTHGREAVRAALDAPPRYELVKTDYGNVYKALRALDTQEG